LIEKKQKNRPKKIGGVFRGSKFFNKKFVVGP
jgi:hypothetical protein